MTNASKKPFLYALLLALVVLTLDQLSKYFMLDYIMAAPERHIEITSFFNLAMVWNHGISFGMFAEHQQPLLLSALALVIVGFLLVWLWKNTDKMVAFGIGLIIGGAIGNVIDRLRFGAVFDFLDFHLYGYHWPAFNIADATIFIGVVVLCVHSMFFENKKTP